MTNPMDKTDTLQDEDIFHFVESCEPDCTPERHAYHEGQWNMAVRVNQTYGLAGHPGAGNVLATPTPQTCDNCGSTRGSEDYNGTQRCVVCRDVITTSTPQVPVGDEELREKLYDFLPECMETRAGWNCGNFDYPENLFICPRHTQQLNQLMALLTQATEQQQISLCIECNYMTKTVGRFANCGKCGAQKYFTQSELKEAIELGRVEGAIAQTVVIRKRWGAGPDHKLSSWLNQEEQRLRTLSKDDK